MKYRIFCQSMDYDVCENSFIRSYIISGKHAGEIEEFLQKQDIHVFSNVILEDVLIIYHGELKNEAEKKLYEKLHRSPYRNYLKRPRPAGDPVVYFMAIDKSAKIRHAYEELRKGTMGEHLKIACYDSEDYQGYAYLKIYNKNASVENMIYYLKELSGCGDMVMVHGEQDGTGGLHAGEGEGDRIVRRLYKLFYRRT